MTSEAALEKQIEQYRRMTGEQRLGIALDLHELSCEIACEGIRRQQETPKGFPARAHPPIGSERSSAVISGWIRRSETGILRS